MNLFGLHAWKKKEEGVASLSYYFGFPGLPHLRSNWVQSTPFIKMEPDLAPFLFKNSESYRL